MTREEAKSELMQIYMSLSEEKKKALDVAFKAMEYDDAKYHEEHGEVVVDKAVWEDAKKALEQEPAYCDRNICLRNEYNGIGCDECEVTKSQEPKADKVIKMRDATPEEQEAIDRYIKSISKPTGVNFWDLADGDLINKNNAITSVCQWGTTLERTGTYTITVAEMKQTITDMLCELPTVAIPSAEPKTGHWITKIKSDLRGDMWPTNPKCSKCGGEPYYSNTIYDYKFCPYCGARMVEPQESEEV